MAALASDWLRHFRLLLWNRWTELNETWQEARSPCPLPSLCFRADRKNKMAALASDWLRHFQLLLWNRWTEFNEDFENYLGQMYPAELEIKDTTESNTSASYLDLLLSIESDGQLRTSLYDKRDDFNFHITNFPFLSSNIPSSPAYGVFISQLIRYARACSSYECFILRAARLSSKLLGQGYVMERLKSSLRKFYGRYGDLIKHYEVSLSQMLHDILGHDHIQWHPQLIRHYTYLQIYYRTGL